MRFIHCITKLNDHKIATIVYPKYFESYHQLQIYDKHLDKWQILVNNLRGIDNISSFRFNQITKQLELIHTQKNTVILKYINLNKDRRSIQYTHNKVLVQEGVNPENNVFMDHENNVHALINRKQQYIWNVNDNNIKSYYFPYIFDRKNRFVLVSSKNIILMIGKYYSSINNWKTGIWKYCLILNDWKLILTFHFNVISWVLSPNEKHIIIIGDKKNNNNIFIVNLIDDKSGLKLELKKSETKLPKISDKLKCYYINMTIMGGPMDETITDGWIKKLFRTSSFKHLNLPPKYLIKLISKWYDQPMLHIFYSNGNMRASVNSKHYQIQFEQILKYSKDI